jgi:serine protease Do
MHTSTANELSQQFGYQGTRGALVQDVSQGEPAARAGLKPGDIITEYQGQRIEDSSQLRNLVAQTAPNTSVKLKVWRDGAERELTATLAELDAKSATPGRSGSDSVATESALSGVRVENLTPELARQLNLPTTARGVAVSDLDADSGAAEAGLRNGDLIVVRRC